MRLAGIEFTERGLIERVVRGIRRPLKGNPPRPRWAVAMDVFCCGASVAIALCREFGLDPDEILK